jgi:ribose-phosphate pyrophosphokinase
MTGDAVNTSTPLLFAPQHTLGLAQRIAQSLGVPMAASEEREFDGGEHKMRPLVDVRGADVFVVQSLCGDAGASANDKLCRLLFFAGTLKDAGARRVTACVPYLAYARKDRRTQDRDPVTTRYVGALFEASGIDRVMVLDVHNEAAFDNAFRCETLRLESFAVFVDSLATADGAPQLVIVSPDVGGIKRAQRFQEAFDRRSRRATGFAFMEKKRARGVVSGEALIGDVADRDVVVFDDMIASGTTMLRTTHAARRAGARRIHVLAAHAVFTQEAERLFTPEGPDRVMVTDSVALRAPFDRYVGGKLAVCSIAALLTEAGSRAGPFTSLA